MTNLRGWGAGFRFLMAFCIVLYVLSVKPAPAQQCDTIENGIEHFSKMEGVAHHIEARPDFIKNWRKYLESRVDGASKITEYDTILIVRITDGIPFMSVLGPSQMIFYYFYDGCRIPRYSVSTFSAFGRFLTLYRRQGT